MLVPIHTGLPTLLSRPALPRLAIVALFIFAASLLATAPVLAGVAVQTSPAAADSLVVQLDPAADLSEINAGLAGQGATLGRIWPEFGLAEVLVVPADGGLRPSSVESLNAVRQSLEAVPGILVAELDATITTAELRSERALAELPVPTSSLADSLPDDIMLGEQWAFEQLGMLDAWAIGQGDANVAVAIIDSGYSLDHEDIAPDSLWTNVAERDGQAGVDDDQNGFIDDVHGWDWIEHDNVTNDPYGHGTHVGGTIAAVTNNTLGVVGLGGNVRVAPLRVLDAQGLGQVSDLIDALYYAFQQNIPVVNMSLVLQTNSTSLHNAIITMHDADMLLVAATGNRSAPVSWPAKYAEVVAVAATDQENLRASFSNYGPEVDLAAPGVDILSTYTFSSYRLLNGTSMAAAHVSALAGLTWSLRPDLSAEELRALMRATALDVNESDFPGEDEYVGAGRISFVDALTQASGALELNPISASPVVAYGGEPITVVISVVAQGGAVTPVSGAAVQAELLPVLPDAESAIESVGSAISVDGVAELTFIAPERWGDYILHLRTGLATSVVDVTVDVHSHLSAVDLVMPDGDVSVDVETIPLRLELRDDSGLLIDAEMIVHLEADMGSFDNGQRMIDVVVSGGEHSLPYDPGTVVGTATLTAQVGDLVDTNLLSVVAGPAAKIVQQSAIEPLNNLAGSASASIRLLVTDAHDNPVADGTPIQLVGERCFLAETELATVDGSVTTTLTAPRGADGPAQIWATAPGTDAETWFEIPLMNHGVWLPMAVTN